MNKDRLEGTANMVGGKVQEAVGDLTGDAKTQAEGELKQAAGRAQDLYGQARDAASDAVDALEDGAERTADFIRDTIETRPYTTAVVALCIGWLIGRMGRRDDY